MNQTGTRYNNPNAKQRPRVFISFSALPPENKAWALRLAERIKSAGLIVLTDDKKLPEESMSAYVLRIVNDTSFTHILIVCDENYAIMANSRGKEMEMDGPIITDRLYQINENKRFIPIARELDAMGRPILPDYLANRSPVFFDNDMVFDKACGDLIARIKQNNEIGTLNTTPASGNVSDAGSNWRDVVSTRTVLWTMLVLSFVILRWGYRFWRIANHFSHSSNEKNEVNKEPVLRKYQDVWVAKDEKIILTDKNGALIPTAIYDEAGNFYEDKAKVQKNGKWGYINRGGVEILPCIYDEVSLYFTEGKASVELDGKWGFVNINGDKVIPIIYEQCSPFNQELAAVKKNGYWGFINEYNKFIIPAIYDHANSFSEGKAEVTKNGKTYFIDIEGKKVKG